MKGRLFSIVFVTILLCLVLGNGAACTGEGTTTYTLTITSTEGGDVTEPGAGTHTYNATQTVDLVATPETDYHFVNWTGDVATVADAENAITTITMNGDYEIAANFGFDMTFIDEVPDTNQPPTVTLPTTIITTNFCAPVAMSNVLEYWDDVVNHDNAQNVTAGLIPETVAEYLGWFMDTNFNPGPGNPDRGNGPHLGTFDKDILPGTTDLIRWDAGHPPVPPPITPPPFPPPAGKLGYDWTMTRDLAVGLDFYTTEIDAGRPLVVSFVYWNPVDEDLAFIDPETSETIDVFSWGAPMGSSMPPNPEEYWMTGDIGHAVTGVGYKLDWDPDGPEGPLPPDDYVIVHDNWSTTPENVAVPWANWNSSHAADPGLDV